MGEGDASVQDEEEIDELQSEEDVSAPARNVAGPLLWTDVAQAAPQASPSKLARMKNAAERTQKKQKRKADESVLQAKREEMDRNKVSLLCPSFLVSHTDSLEDFRCGQTLFLPPGPDRAFQTFCGHQGATCQCHSFLRYVV